MKVADSGTFLHWDNSSRIVRVYGPDAAAETVLLTIAETIKSMIELQETVTFPVVRYKRKELLTAWKQLKGPLKENILGFRVNDLVLEVQGDSDTLTTMRAWLETGKFTLIDSSPVKHAHASGAGTTTDVDEEELCSVCMCEVEQPAYYYRACGHGGCTTCLTYQFSRLAEITVPATCFSTDCGRCAISWPDIKAVVPSEAVDVITSAAVSKYIRENSQTFRFCPSAGCDQIIDLSQVVTPASENEEEELGGAVSYCDQCRAEYCLQCSDRDHKPRESHQGDACADTIEEANVWRPHFQHIADTMLTLHCPSCQAAFLDFNGCCAVECGGSGCNKYFCGYCLHPDQNSSTSHAHVRICAKNPRRGDYFCSQEELNKLHRFTRIGQLRSYFEKCVPKGDTKRKLLKNLEPLLADLGIFSKDIV